MGKEVPAKAAAPSGHSLSRARASRKRPRSRPSISTWARRWWPRVTGCAVCRWVKPGMIVAACASARSINTSCSRTIPASRWSSASRSHSRKSVATWSLRDRAVCSRPAASPISAASLASTFMCTSSSARSKASSPASASRRTISNPCRIARPSSSPMMPWRISILQWASEAVISWKTRRRSTSMEALMASMISEGPASNRPPHMGLVLPASSSLEPVTGAAPPGLGRVGGSGCCWRCCWRRS